MTRRFTVARLAVCAVALCYVSFKLRPGSPDAVDVGPPVAAPVSQSAPVPPVAPQPENIYGVVIDPFGEPVAGARLQWVGVEDCAYSSTDGQFVLRGSQNSQTLSCFHDYWRSTQLPVTTESPSPITIEYSSTCKLTCAISGTEERPYLVLVGPLTGDQLPPCRAVKSHEYSFATSSCAATLTSLVPGRYDLLVVVGGRLPRSAQEAIEFRMNGETVHVDVDLTRAAEWPRLPVAGRVLLDGQPAQRQSLRISAVPLAFPGRAGGYVLGTDDSGAFSVEPPGLAWAPYGLRLTLSMQNAEPVQTDIMDPDGLRDLLVEFYTLPLVTLKAGDCDGLPLAEALFTTYPSESPATAGFDGAVAVRAGDSSATVSLGGFDGPSEHDVSLTSDGVECLEAGLGFLVCSSLGERLWFVLGCHGAPNDGVRWSGANEVSESAYMTGVPAVRKLQFVGFTEGGSLFQTSIDSTESRRLSVTPECKVATQVVTLLDAGGEVFAGRVTLSTVSGLDVTPTHGQRRHSFAMRTIESHLLSKDPSRGELRLALLRDSTGWVSSEAGVCAVAVSSDGSADKTFRFNASGFISGCLACDATIQYSCDNPIALYGDAGIVLKGTGWTARGRLDERGCYTVFRLPEDLPASVYMVVGRLEVLLGRQEAPGQALLLAKEAEQVLTREASNGG